MDELNIIIQNVLLLKKFYTDDEWRNKLNYLVDRIIKAKKIFVFGVGRSGYIGRCFAMRLMHLGFKSYFVGETSTPSYEKDDLLILSTDGLHKMVTQNTILSILNADTSIELKTKKLIQAALDSGGKDNVTIVLARINQPLK